MNIKNRFVPSAIILVIWLLTIANLTSSTVLAASVNKVVNQTLSTGATDPDHDGLTNSQEHACGTKSNVADSNHNGILDGADDQDRDGLSNSAEFLAKTKCRNRDTDRDGLSDGQEVRLGTSPKKADSDRDGVKDGKELNQGTDPTKPDSDGDGIKDGRDAHPNDPKDH